MNKVGTNQNDKLFELINSILTKENVDKFCKALFPTLKSSWLSFLIIIVLLIIVSFTDQGITLIVDLSYSPVDFIWIIILVNYMALCFSHFPVYLAESSRSTLVMRSKSVLWGFGEIYYLPHKTDSEINDHNIGAREKAISFENFLRRSIGVVFYLTWIVGLFKVYQAVFYPELSILVGILAISGILIVLFFYLNKFKNAVKEIKSQDHKEIASLKDKAKCIFKIYGALIYLIIAMIIVLGFMGCCKDWSRLGIILLILTSILSVILFIYFRVLRSSFCKFFGISEKWSFVESSKLEFEFVSENKRWPIVLWPFKFLRNTSNNAHLLKWIAIVGRLNAIFLFIISLLYLFIGPSFMGKTNPLIIVSSWLLFYYTVYVILSKHHNFYKKIDGKDNLRTGYSLNTEACTWLGLNSGFVDFVEVPKAEYDTNKITENEILNKKYKFHSILFTKFLPITYLVLLLIAISTYKTGTDRHLILTEPLCSVPIQGASKTEMEDALDVQCANLNESCNSNKATKDTCALNSFAVFKKCFKERNKQKKIYTISSFGGGLKANTWNLLLMNELTQRKPEFLSSTFSISSVSGGTIGMANFYTMLDTTQIEKNKRIKTIGLSNTLSHEASFLFSWDMLNNLFPNPCPASKGKDRSFFSMRENARMSLGLSSVADTEEHMKSFPEFWSNKNKKHNVPPLFANAKATAFYYGTTSPFYDLDHLGAAVDLVHQKELVNCKLTDSHTHTCTGQIHCPSFYDAISPSNRFPIVSPAAHFQRKGHFVDGGYFENSGLMTTLNLIQENKSYLDSFELYNILINTGKSEYLRFLLENSEARKVLLDSMNFRGILSGPTPTPILEMHKTLRWKNSSAELSSILSAVINLDGLPYAMTEIMERDTNFLQLHLPHKIFLDDIETMYKGKVNLSPDMIQFLNSHNALLDAILDQSDYNLHIWGYVEPPLSRLLSIPGYEFEKAMLDHPLVKWQIGRIVE